MDELYALIDEYSRISNAIRKQIIEEIIEAIPTEYQGAKQLNGGCFTVKFSETQKYNNLSAEFYDFQEQKRQLLSVIDSSRISIENQISILKSIAETGKMKKASGTVLFHPDITVKLQKILNLE